MRRMVEKKMSRAELVVLIDKARSKVEDAESRGCGDCDCCDNTLGISDLLDEILAMLWRSRSLTNEDR